MEVEVNDPRHPIAAISTSLIAQVWDLLSLEDGSHGKWNLSRLQAHLPELLHLLCSDLPENCKRLKQLVMQPVEAGNSAEDAFKILKTLFLYRASERRNCLSYRVKDPGHLTSLPLPCHQGCDRLTKSDLSIVAALLAFFCKDALLRKLLGKVAREELVDFFYDEFSTTDGDEVPDVLDAARLGFFSLAKNMTQKVLDRAGGLDPFIEALLGMTSGDRSSDFCLVMHTACTAVNAALLLGGGPSGQAHYKLLGELTRLMKLAAGSLPTASDANAGGCELSRGLACISHAAHALGSLAASSENLPSSTDSEALGQIQAAFLALVDVLRVLCGCGSPAAPGVPAAAALNSTLEALSGLAARYQGAPVHCFKLLSGQPSVLPALHCLLSNLSQTGELQGRLQTSRGLIMGLLRSVVAAAVEVNPAGLWALLQAPPQAEASTHGVGRDFLSCLLDVVASSCMDAVAITACIVDASVPQILASKAEAGLLLSGGLVDILACLLRAPTHLGPGAPAGAVAHVLQLALHSLQKLMGGSSCCSLSVPGENGQQLQGRCWKALSSEGSCLDWCLLMLRQGGPSLSVVQSILSSACDLAAALMQNVRILDQALSTSRLLPVLCQLLAAAWAALGPSKPSVLLLLKQITVIGRELGSPLADAVLSLEAMAALLVSVSMCGRRLRDGPVIDAERALLVEMAGREELARQVQPEAEGHGARVRQVQVEAKGREAPAVAFQKQQEPESLSNLEFSTYSLAAGSPLSSLVQLLSSTDPEMREWAAGALRASGNVASIAAAGALPLLVQMLSSSLGAQREAAGALRVLAYCNSDNQVSIPAAGALPPLVRLLSSRDVKVQKEAAGALWNLAFNAENQVSIAASGAFLPLVRLLSSPIVEVKEWAAGAIGTLAAHNADNQVSIAAALAVPPLVQLLSSQDVEVQKQAAGALRMLAYDNADNQDSIADASALRPLVRLLSSHDVEVQKQAAGALWNLAFNDGNKVYIVASGALPPLVQLLSSPDAEVKEWAAGALRTLAEGHADHQALITQAKREAPRGVVPVVAPPPPVAWC